MINASRERRCLQVGLMRSGRMLAEDEPARLLTQYNQTVCSSLDMHRRKNERSACSLESGERLPSSVLRRSDSFSTAESDSEHSFAWLD